MYMFYYKSRQHQCSLFCNGLWNEFVQKKKKKKGLQLLFHHKLNSLILIHCKLFKKASFIFFKLKMYFSFSIRVWPKDSLVLCHHCKISDAGQSVLPRHQTLARDQTAPLQLHTVYTFKTRSVLFSFQVIFVNV